jgi:glycosyltransferase involved in cell wall biosynthesis
MRITIATGPLLPVPPLRGGSVPRMWMGLAEEFARRGHDTCIFARSFNGQPCSEILRGVAYQRFGGFSQSGSIGLDLAKDLAYSMLAARRLPRSDVLVTNNFWLPVICALARKSAGRVVVNANRFPKGQYKLYGGAAAIAAASRSVRDAVVRESPVLAGRTFVIPNTVDEAFLRNRIAPRRSSERKTLLFVGRIHPEKGVHLLIEAFAAIRARHQDWQLLIVGPVLEADGGGGAPYLQQLRHAARGLPVRFADPVFDPSALAQIYQESDLFCYPSLADLGEALPVAPLEAMACGLPVVASAIDCLMEIVSDGDTGWIFDHRQNATGALRAVLEEAMRSPARLAEMGARALKFAQRYSRERVADEYLLQFGRLPGN